MCWYATHGYEVVDRNWRSPTGELDLVACRPALVVFCEIKTLRTPDRFGSARTAVGRARSSGAFVCSPPSGCGPRPPRCGPIPTSSPSPACASRSSRRPSRRRHWSQPASLPARFRPWRVQLPARPGLPGGVSDVVLPISRARPGMSGAVSEVVLQVSCPTGLDREICRARRTLVVGVLIGRDWTAVPAGRVPVAAQVRRIGGDRDVVAGADGIR